MKTTLSCLVCLFYCSITLAQALHFSDTLNKDKVFSPTPFTPKAAVKTFAAPTLFIAAGLYATTNNGILSRYHIHEERNEDYPNFNHRADDYFQYAPLLILTGIHLFNSSQSGNTWGRQAMLFAKSFALMNATVLPLKQFTNVKRPNGSSHSFPSGHTATVLWGQSFSGKNTAGIILG